MPVLNSIGELQAAVYAILTGDSALLTSGIDPATGGPRQVAVRNQVEQNLPAPYVRVTATDTLPLDEETYNFEQPVGDVIGLLVDVFSNHEPECWRIAAHVRHLLKHREIVTANFWGYSWFTSVDFFTDNVTEPNKIYRRATIRFRVTAVES